MHYGTYREFQDKTGSDLTCPLLPRTWDDSRVTPDVWEPPPVVVKATSLLMHSPLLSIHFYHAQSFFLVPQTFLFHSMLFSHCPSIPFIYKKNIIPPYLFWVQLMANSLTLHQVLLQKFFLPLITQPLPEKKGNRLLFISYTILPKFCFRW